MKPVIQEERSGCAIASAAALAGVTYGETRKIANRMGIFAQDRALWSETNHICNLLAALNIQAGKNKTPFHSWDTLPDCAVLAIKWHLENGKPFWHWVVFVRDTDHQYVLDPKKALRTNVRTDFGRMKPKWYLEIVT